MRLDIIYMQMHSKAYESRKAKTTNNWDGGSTVQTDQYECKELTGREESKWSEQQTNAAYKRIECTLLHVLCNNSEFQTQL